MGKLHEKRQEDAVARQQELDAAKADQEENDKKVQQTLDEHDVRLEDHKTDLVVHKEQLGDHTDKLNRHNHQLGLVKTALDGRESCETGLGYAYHRHRGFPSADKLIDWECKLNAEGKMIRDEDGNPTGQRDVCPGSAECPAKRRRDKCRRPLPSSDQVPERRRLANRSKSHIVVLEQLLDEVN